jgi:hypothetical protein
MVDCSIHFEITTKARIVNKEKDFVSVIFSTRRSLEAERKTLRKD